MNKLEPPSPEDFFPGRFVFFRIFFWGEFGKGNLEGSSPSHLRIYAFIIHQMFFLLIERPYLASGQIIATKPLTGHLLNGSLVWESPPKIPENHSALGIIG